MFGLNKKGIAVILVAIASFLSPEVLEGIGGLEAIVALLESPFVLPAAAIFAAATKTKET